MLLNAIFSTLLYNVTIKKIEIIQLLAGMKVLLTGIVVNRNLPVVLENN